MRSRFLPICLVALSAATAMPAAASAANVFGILSAPMRMIRHLAVHGPYYHRHHGRPRVASHAVRGAGAAAAAGALTATYWPGAFDDVFGYALAPSGDNGFWSHGAGDLVAATLKPAAPRDGSTTGAAGTAGDCNNAAAATREADDIYKRIADRVTPTPAQRGAFDDLHAALTKASQRIDGGCPASFAKAAPPERLKAIADRLSDMRQAVLIVRTPFEAAYRTLTPKQKEALNGAPAAPACGADMAAAQGWPGDAIAQAVQPNEDQQAGLEALRITTLGMTQSVAASCPDNPPRTALARLDAAGDRLNAMIYAARVIDRSLANVYMSLTNEQKAKFQTLRRSARRDAQSAEAR